MPCPGPQAMLEMLILYEPFPIEIQSSPDNVVPLTIVSLNIIYIYININISYSNNLY